MPKRLLFVDDGQSQTIVADSFSGPNHWSKPLVSISTRRWKSNQSLMRGTYSGTTSVLTWVLDATKSEL